MLLHKLVEETENIILDFTIWDFFQKMLSIKIHEKLGFRIIGRREKSLK